MECYCKCNKSERQGMVPVNFHQWKEEIRRVLFRKAGAINDGWDPFIAAWLGYAFSIDSVEHNQPLLELLNRMKRWLEEGDVWSYERNLGPIACYLWLLKKTAQSLEQEFVAQFVDKVHATSPDKKSSILRDPEQVFLLALGASGIGDDSTKKCLIKLASEQIKLGSLQRQILYGAVLRELGEEVNLPNGEPADEGDIIGLLWWVEKYQGDKKQAWERFSSITERIALEPENASDAQRILREPEMAMLYEALVAETKHPEPVFLFDYFPFHPRIRQVARDHFVNKKYATAVFEGTKALNEMIQQVSGVKDKSEAELVQSTMKNISDPMKLKICFNDFLKDDSGKNEQAGLATLCEGIFRAFRNPKGHKPEDHPLVKLDPYEALQQLIIINYMMVRVERANGDRKRKESEYGE